MIENRLELLKEFPDYKIKYNTNSYQKYLF